MKNLGFKSLGAWLLLGQIIYPSCTSGKSVPNSTSSSTTATSPVTTETAPSPEGNFSEAELDELLSPIALYPDPLLAQILPASTFVDQLDEASRVLRGKSSDSLIANQGWDV